MTGPASPLERMLEAFVQDKERGDVGPPRRYLDIFDELSQEATTRAGTKPEVPRVTADPADDRFGPYRLVHELGSGGQGSVWLADDTRLSRQVALKLLHAHGPGALLHFERFRREARIASRLDHPSICPVFETGVQDGLPFIAMRHVEGESLATRISRARDGRVESLDHAMSTLLTAATEDEVSAMAAEVPSTSPETPRTRGALDDVLRLVEDCARALHAAHEVGIVHRDFKPGNVMIGIDGRPVLLDFGLARDDDLDDDLTRTGDVFGTPSYMAPEQIDAESGVPDRRADVWALGVVLYECLALERPFQAVSRHGLYRAIAETEPAPLRRHNRSIGKDIEVVARTALEKDRNRRYQTAEHLADELRRLRERRPILARPAGPVLRLRRWVQRNPYVAAALLLALIGFAGSWIGMNRAQRNFHLSQARLGDWRALRSGWGTNRLRSTFDKHWPAVPSKLEEIDEWLVDATRVEERLPAARRRLADLLERPEEPGAPDRIRILKEVVQGIEDLRPLVVKMAARRATAANLERRSLVEAGDAWDAAVEGIRGEPRYRGLVIKPQLGLLPLGQDKKSRLFEFAYLLTGEPPKRDQNGRLQLAPGSAVVLVLIPGGPCHLGFQISDAKAPNFVGNPIPTSLLERRQARGVIEADLGPFFISKYEMTQDQWERITGSNPSLHVAPLRPVERIDWYDARNALARVGLVLPIEAWWERAARGGTSTVWHTGKDLVEAARNANTADLRFHAAHSGNHTKLDDGHVFHSPVAAFPPNPFGLHGVIGNLAEWCADPFVDGEPMTVTPDLEVDASMRVRRGSFFAINVASRSVATRDRVTPRVAQPVLGVRPALAVIR
ncbi:MAG: hypothetical protein CMJ83_04205 [Planctomycetes bacterium]|nr:hypothetical protein [Planctomycetota bacterium]